MDCIEILKFLQRIKTITEDQDAYLEFIERDRQLAIRVRWRQGADVRKAELVASEAELNSQPREMQHLLFDRLQRQIEHSVLPPTKN